MSPHMPVINNPAAIMLAYRYAEQSNPDPRARAALSAASNRWADEPMLGSLSPVAGALAVAEAYGVEGYFMVGASEVTIADAISNAEEAAGREATPEEESYIQQAIATAMAAPEHARQILAEAWAHSPPGLTKQALDEIRPQVVEMISNASKEGLLRAKELQDQAMKLQESLTKVPKSLSTAAVAVAVVAVVAAAVWFIPSTGGRKR